jgi:integrase
VLTLPASDPLHAYIVVSMLTGARTEELQALRWQHVHLDPIQGPGSTVGPPYVEVWRSVRANTEAKTKKSRRTLALPSQAGVVLRAHRVEQMRQQLRRGITEPSGLVFTTSTGAPLDAANVRRDFRRALTLVPGIEPQAWTPRELRHSFVSLLSDSRVSIEEISRLVGHAGTHVTELVYRHQLRPVIESGAIAMERLFASVDAGETGGESA